MSEGETQSEQSKTAAINEQSQEARDQTYGPDQPEGQDDLQSPELSKLTPSELLERINSLVTNINNQTAQIMKNNEALKQQLLTLEGAGTPEESGKSSGDEAPKFQVGSPTSASSKDNRAA